MVYTIPSAAPWDTLLRREKSLSWIPDFGNESSPRALDGTQQFRNTGTDKWRARFSGEQLRKKEEVLAWMGQEILLRGGATPCDVPSLLCRYVPRQDVATTVIASVGIMAAGAVSGRVVLTHAGELKAGMHFADYDAVKYGWRMHRIDSVSAVGGQPAQRDITFWPRLRFAIADAHTLEFDEPRCVMRLAASDSMDLELSMRKRGEPSAEFVEAF